MLVGWFFGLKRCQFVNNQVSYIVRKCTESSVLNTDVANAEIWKTIPLTRSGFFARSQAMDL